MNTTAKQPTQALPQKVNGEKSGYLVANRDPGREHVQNECMHLQEIVSNGTMLGSDFKPTFWSGNIKKVFQTGRLSQSQVFIPTLHKGSVQGFD